MNTIEILSAVLATSAFTTLLNHILTIKSNKVKNRLTTAKAKEAEAKVKEAEADAEIAEVERDEKLSEYYRKELNKVLTELRLVRKELDEVRRMLLEKESKDCIHIDCPNREMKSQHGKN